MWELRASRVQWCAPVDRSVTVGGGPVPALPVNHSSGRPYVTVGPPVAPQGRATDRIAMTRERRLSRNRMVILSRPQVGSQSANLEPRPPFPLPTSVNNIVRFV